MMASTYMLRKHQATMRSAGRPEAIAERQVNREANKRALADCKSRYPVLTAENFEAADEYRKERAAFWTKHLHSAPDGEDFSHDFDEHDCGEDTCVCADRGD